MSESEGAERSQTLLLEGLRVVELGGGIAVSLAGLLLAEQGAEVVHVVGGSEPSADPVLDAILARGKTEASIPWHTANGYESLKQLLGSADVAIESEPSVKRSTSKIDFDRIRVNDNPGLINCRISPFPDFDPRSTLPGHEAIAGSAGCLYTKPLGRPQLHDFPIGSVTSALYAANAIVAALIARISLGRGQQVETNFLQCDMVSQVLQIFVQSGVPRGFLPLKMVGSPAMRCWECNDGRYVYLHITMPAHNVRMLELLEEGGFGDEVARLREVMSPQTMQDPSQVKSIPEAKKIKEIYEEIFRSRSADEWEVLLGQELCCIKVRHIEEWLEDSLEAGMSDAARIDDPIFGELLGPGPLVTSSEIANHVAPRAVDADAFEQLAARWASAPSPLADEPAAEQNNDGSSAAPGAPLQGVRVMDLSRIIAGPCAARVLAELGAEVISLQSPTRLDWALSFHLIFNAGKKSVTLDFRDDAGKEKLWAVLEKFQPDAFIQNYRHLDVARDAGIDPESVRRRFPNIAYTHLNAYGNHGIWKDRPGFEQVVQAVSGIQLAYARGGRPKLLPSPIIDIGCGLLGAFGTLLGLYNQKRGGEGAFVTTHLTSMAVLLQLPQIVAGQRRKGLERARERGVEVVYDPDREVVADVLSSLTTSACLAGPRGDLRRWLEHVGLTREGEVVEGRELEIAARYFTRLAPSRWPQSFAEAGVADTVALLPYPRIRRLASEMGQFDPRKKPFLHKTLYPGAEEPLAFMRSPITMSASQLPDISPPPLRGADTAAVLNAIGEPAGPDADGIPYPPSKPLLVWLASFVRWGYFAWKSGNI